MPRFDYQIGGDYEPPAGVTVVSRDWFAGEPLDGDGGYSICYVNAFQTQPDEAGVDRPDERSNWPPELVLRDLGDDPNWEGEYLDRPEYGVGAAAALDHVAPMIDTCAAKGFDAVELDNLDSWTRLRRAVRSGRGGRLRRAAHRPRPPVGLAVGPEEHARARRRRSRWTSSASTSRSPRSAGYYDECAAYTDVFGDAVIVVEYTADGFAAACDAVGDRVSVVLRDVAVTTPDSADLRLRLLLTAAIRRRRDVQSHGAGAVEPTRWRLGR